MARERIGIGSYGEITVRCVPRTVRASACSPLDGVEAPEEVKAWLRANPELVVKLGAALSGANKRGETWQAETAYRTTTGVKTKVRASGPSREKAKAALKEKLLRRAKLERVGREIASNSPVDVLIDLFIDYLDKDTNRRRPQTIAKYKNVIRRTLRPAIGQLRINELGVEEINRYLENLYQAGKPSDAKQSRFILAKMGSLAMGRKLMSSNPMREATPEPAKAREDIDRGAKTVSIEDIKRFRQGIVDLEKRDRRGPAPDGQLRSIFDLWVSTGARPNEILALRMEDLDLTSTPPTITLAGTIVEEGGVHRQPRGKTDSAYRRIPLPPGAVKAIQRRLALIPVVEAKRQDNAEKPRSKRDYEPLHTDLLFYSRNGTPLSLRNLSRNIRKVRADVGILDFFVYQLRASAATHVAGAAGQEQAALLLGHTEGDTTTLRNHYLGQNLRVIDPKIADIMSELLPDIDD